MKKVSKKPDPDTMLELTARLDKVREKYPIYNLQLYKGNNNIIFVRLMQNGYSVAMVPAETFLLEAESASA
jgi:hypothetical protein